MAEPDDASGSPAALAANSSAAGTNRKANADSAYAQANGKRPHGNGAATRSANGRTHANGGAPHDEGGPPFVNGETYGDVDTAIAPHGKSSELDPPPGREPLPDDGPSFVDAVHERVDLVAIGEKLLRSGDEKVVQRAFEGLLEMKYGKNAILAAENDGPMIINDLPRPIPGHRSGE